MLATLQRQRPVPGGPRVLARRRVDRGRAELAADGPGRARRSTRKISPCGSSAGEGLEETRSGARGPEPRGAMKIRKVGVLGAGLMGSGIAEVCAKAGYDTVVREVSEELVADGSRAASRRRSRRRSRRASSPPADRDAARRPHLRHDPRSRTSPTATSSSRRSSRTSTPRRRLFGALDALCQPATIFCSNTSSLTITEMSAATPRPDRFAGLHFFNPVPVMKLVEVVRTIATVGRDAPTRSSRSRSRSARSRSARRTTPASS